MPRWKDPKERFMDKITKTKSCWLWNSDIHTTGYGLFSIKYKYFKAHRVAYLFFKGEIPKGLSVCHKCDTPRCVNPDHLFLATNKENMRDASKKGRLKGRAAGSRNGRAKLNEEKVREIRRKFETGKYTIKSLSEEYKISRYQISDIVKNIGWKHA